MRQTLTWMTLFACVLLTTPSVFAQGAGIEWEILNHEVMDLYHAGKYDRAIVVGREALKIAEGNVGPNHPDVATSLNNLAALYGTQGLYAVAEPLYKRALKISENALGPSHPHVATKVVEAVADIGRA